MQNTRLLQLRPYWKHLRLPFQISLSPLFLWGCFLALGAKTLTLRPFLPGFLAFHFFLYTGITAYNSAYDRDEGPVGGMLQPPAVPPHLLEFSLVVQIIGGILAACVNISFLILYLTIAAMGIAYSHPRVRWKASPVASTLTVFIGQGAFGYLAGWSVAKGDLTGVFHLAGILGLLSAAFTTLGLYPLTQVYQIEEDRKRGDQTLAVVLGPTRALHFGFVCLTLAGIAAVVVMLVTSRMLDMWLITVAYVFILWQVHRFAEDYAQNRHSIVSAFRVAMRLNYLTASGFLIFIGRHLLFPGK